MTKVTKAEMFAMIKDVEGVKENQAMVDFIDHELELLAKKSANKKPTKTQVENEGLKEVITAVLSESENPMTVTEMLATKRFAENTSNSDLRYSSL